MLKEGTQIPNWVVPPLTVAQVHWRMDSELGCRQTSRLLLAHSALQLSLQLTVSLSQLNGLVISVRELDASSRNERCLTK